MPIISLYRNKRECVFMKLSLLADIQHSAMGYNLRHFHLLAQLEACVCGSLVI